MEKQNQGSTTKYQSLKRKIIREILDKRTYLYAAYEIARSITAFATNRSWLSFIEGAFSSINVAADNFGFYSSDFFNVRQGWDLLVCGITQKPIHDIILPILEHYPSKTLNFKYEHGGVSKIHHLPNNISIGTDQYGIWYSFENNKEEEVLKNLYDEVFKSINSNVFSIVERGAKVSNKKYGFAADTSFVLQAEKFNSINSKTSKKYLNHIKQAIDKNINRSIMFLGMPGTGKTSMANTIINELGLRTLKFKYSPNTSDLAGIENIIDALKVEALLLDDFDTVDDSINLLGFLERMHSKLKLTIAIANTLSTIKPAILRPARFDEIITVNKLDTEVIRGILGNRYAELYPKVKEWPVAYIKEIIERININPNININVQIKELDKRVKNQIKSLKGSANDIF